MGLTKPDRETHESAMLATRVQPAASIARFLVLAKVVYYM